MKSMREALPKEDMLNSDGQRMATGMLDEQMAQTLSGKGLGLADMMLKQLTRNPGAAAGKGLLNKLDAANREAGASASPATDSPAAGMGAAVFGTGRLAAARSAALQVPRGDPAQSGTPAGGAPATGSSAATPQDFVRRMMGHAVEAQKTSGIPAHFVLGQAALESGWGKREIVAQDGSSSHNLFGIKAGRNWQGATVDAVTTEYVNGTPRKVVEKFRAYATYTEAFTDYANLLARNSRYAGVVSDKGDAAAFAGRMQAAGYATDPAYARKLTAVINQTLALQGVA
jgi:flagellar protein FlgJ